MNARARRPHPARTPRATYRLQLRPDALTFDNAIAWLPYLAKLGISHVYLSPILTATTGSTHGYDVVDVDTVSPALGGRDGLVRLSRAARAHGLGLVVDIVPNHLGVAAPRENRAWWDVLRHGTGSAFAAWFDLDTAPDNGCDGAIALPVLGSDDGDDALTVDRTGDEPMLAYFDHRFPIVPGTDDDDPAAVHRRQHYRLVPWDSGLLGYRRFFTVSDLAGVRVEDPAVFDATHREIASWIDDDLVDGLRVDHPDGLADPAGYLARLREVVGPDRWLVIEKILGRDEPLDPTLPVDGTTGYDALAEFDALFLDPDGAPGLTELCARTTGMPGDAPWLDATEHALAVDVLRGDLAPEVARLVRALRIDGYPVAAPDPTEAVIDLLAHVPVYRTDYTPVARVLPAVLDDRIATRPDLADALSAVGTVLARGGEAATRFQQVCGAATAKSSEDCLFYRTARLVSAQEVGGDPGTLGTSTGRFHLVQRTRSREWPATMTTVSTHDTKRAADVRARIGVLSQVPDRFSAAVDEFASLAPAPDQALGAFLWQNVIGVWPVDPADPAVPARPDDAVRLRLREFARKAARENGTRTSWTAVDDEFETALDAWIDAVCTGATADAVAAFVASIAPHAVAVSLARTAVHLGAPGVPDIYQGTEVFDDSLVDPDNRRPIDLARVSAPTGIDERKSTIVRAVLALRARYPDAFVGGTYLPVTVEGAHADRVVAFARGSDDGPVVAVVALRHTVHGSADAHAALPGRWVDVLTGREYTDRFPTDTLSVDGPVAVLERG